MIELRDLTKKFGDFTAVDGLSLSIETGEFFGLLGPNGAGKTTTLRMLATLIKPDSGDAFIDGSSIVKNPDEVRGKIGFLTSELKLEDFFTPDFLFLCVISSNCNSSGRKIIECLIFSCKSFKTCS